MWFTRHLPIFGHFSHFFADPWHAGANLATFATKLQAHVCNSVDFDIPEGLRWHTAGSRGTCQKHAIFGHFSHFFTDPWHVGANLTNLPTKLLAHTGNSVDFDIPEGLRWHTAGSRGTCQKHAIFGHFSLIFTNSWHVGANLTNLPMKLSAHVRNCVQYHVPEGLR